MSTQDFIKEYLFENIMSQGGLDGYHNYSGYDWSGWLCGFSKNRDSDILTESNFYVSLEELGGEKDGVIEVRRVSHWACGWFEQIMIKADCLDKVKMYLKQREAVSDYPVLDDMDFSAREEMAREDDLKYYEDEFITNVCEYIGINPDNLKPKNRERIALFASGVYHEDCGYQGQEDAFVDETSIKRFLNCEYETHELKDTIIKWCGR